MGKNRTQQYLKRAHSALIHLYLSITEYPWAEKAKQYVATAGVHALDVSKQILGSFFGGLIFWWLIDRNRERPPPTTPSQPADHATSITSVVQTTPFAANETVAPTAATRTVQTAATRTTQTALPTGTVHGTPTPPPDPPMLPEIFVSDLFQIFMYSSIIFVVLYAVSYRTNR